MTATGASGLADQSFSTRLYRATQRHKHWFFIAPALLIVLTVVIYPIIFSTGVSFFRVTFASQSRPFVGLQNFERMLSNDDFIESTFNTLYYVIFSVSGSFALGFGVALLIRRITVGKDLLRLILIIPITMAPIVVGLMWNWMLDPLFGLINWFLDLFGIPGQTFLAQAATARMTVVLVDIWQWYPLVFLIIEAGMATLPRAPLRIGAAGGRILLDDLPAHHAADAATGDSGGAAAAHGRCLPHLRYRAGDDRWRVRR